MKIHHLSWTSDGRSLLFPNEAVRRTVVRTLARVAGTALLLFNVEDDELHVVLGVDRKRAGRFAQAIFRALSPMVLSRLESARIRPVATRSHLRWLVRHVLTLGDNRDSQQSLPLSTGSCFQDLVGARYVEGLSLQLATYLPRLRLREVHSIVGLPERPIEPATDEVVFAAGVVRLAVAGAAAACVGPELRGQVAPLARMRAATAQLGRAAGFATKDLARVLGITPRRVRDLYRAEPGPPLERAVRVRLGLEEIAATAA